MKLISWNVNGFRAVLTKGFDNILKDTDADVFCLQETKMQEGQTDYAPEGYSIYWNSAEKKGYSGVAALSRTEPLAVMRGIGIDEHDTEGRVLTLEYHDFFLVVCYTPNSQDGLRRLDYRQDWDKAFRNYVMELDKIKPVVICGDLNVAHKEIDLKNPKTNRMNPGFTDQERQGLTDLLGAGFVDTFRHFYPDATGAYTWWSYRNRARQNNAGWRIDYFIVSERLMPRITSARILSDIMGSDHCPVEIEIATAGDC